MENRSVVKLIPVRTSEMWVNYDLSNLAAEPLHILPLYTDQGVGTRTKSGLGALRQTPLKGDRNVVKLRSDRNIVKLM